MSYREGDILHVRAAWRYATMVSYQEATVDYDNARTHVERTRYKGGRQHPCPQCKRERMLTAEEKRRGYRCNDCARGLE